MPDNTDNERLWKTLDALMERANSIESKVSEIVRLEEKVSAQNQTLARFGNKIEDQEIRVRDLELYKANQFTKAEIERRFCNFSEELERIELKQEKIIEPVEEKIEILQTGSNTEKGKKDVAKEILKWISTILAGILIVILSGKNN